MTDRGWLGEVRDPTTGLNHLGARYYDAVIGRFISTDPPRGSVIPDNVPPGHVSVRGVSVEEFLDALVVRGKFPK